jgi:DNA-binding NarL/FixJ family response regulator
MKVGAWPAFGMIEILVLEHPPAVRRTLCARLSVEPDMLVVGEADDKASAVRLAQALQPRVILLDAEMPNLDLCGTVQAIRSVVAASVVILTLHTAAVTQALAADDSTVVGKHEGTPALLAAIRRAVAQRT